MATIAVDSTLPRRKRKKLNRTAAKAEEKRLLAQRKYSEHKILRRIMDIIKLVILVVVSAIVGKYAVTGAYDLMWELHQPLPTYAVEFLVVSALIIVYGSHRTARGKPTSWGTVWFTSGLLAAWAIAVLIINVLHPQLLVDTGHGMQWQPVKTSPDLWHWMVPDATYRNIFGRDWLEGLYGGLFGVFVGWNTLKRRSKHHLLSRLFKGWMCNLDEEDRDVRSWMVWITPVLVVALGLPFAYLCWRGELIGHDNATRLHEWVHSIVPWHANLPLNNKQSSLIAKAQDSVTAALPMFVIGFASARWFGRVPAFGVMDEYQEFLALRVIAKRGDRGLYGHMFHRGILRWYQSKGYQLALMQEFEIGVHQGDPVVYAQTRLDKYDRGLVIPLRVAMVSIVPLCIIGAYFLLKVAKYN